MAEMKIRHTETAGDYSSETVFEGKDLEFIHEDLLKTLFGVKNVAPAPEGKKEVKLAAVETKQPGVEGNVVAIYDNAGIPSFMYKFTRVSNKELFGGSDKPHPAFVIGGEVYDEIYISVYPNCEINGKPYSLPYQKPWTNLTNDEASEACFNKGEGWHLMTAAEWGLIANISLKNGTLPHGNTNNGQYHADASEKGVKYDGGDGRTLTGSGRPHGRTITPRRAYTIYAETCGKCLEGCVLKTVYCMQQRTTTQHSILTSRRRETTGTELRTIPATS